MIFTISLFKKIINTNKHKKRNQKYFLLIIDLQKDKAIELMDNKEFFIAFI